MLGSVYWWLPTFRDALSVPLSLEDGTDRLCRKVGNCRSVLRATKWKRRRHWHPWRRPEVTYLFFPSPHPSHDKQYYTTPLPLAKVLRYLYFDSAVTEIVVALMTSFYYVTPKTFSVNRTRQTTPFCYFPLHFDGSKRVLRCDIVTSLSNELLSTSVFAFPWLWGSLASPITFPWVTNQFRHTADNLYCCRGDADHAADDTEVVGRGGGLDGRWTPLVPFCDEVWISSHVRRSLLRCRLC